MRIGSLARSHRGLVTAFLAATSIATLPLATFGQAQNASYAMGSSSGNLGAQQALYTTAGGGGSINGQNVVPAGYCQQCNGGCYVGDGDACNGGDCYGGCDGCRGAYPGCCPMGAGGTDPAIGYDLMNDVGVEGELVDQRGPHYFDVRAEAVFLTRDKSFGRNVDFTAINVGTDVVLRSNQLDIEDPQAGFRIIGRYDICPLSVVEFGYTGVFGWDDKATFTDPTNNLYSLFSRPAPEAGNFGSSPSVPVPVSTIGGPNPFTERANTQSIELSSDLQTAEISYRRYWLGYKPCISGTLLAGFRYTKVNENFQFSSLGSEQFPQSPPSGTANAALDYKEDCENNLAGFQTGGDIWLSLMQGLRIGTEGKVGIYDNHSRLANRISTTPNGVQPPSQFEEFKNDHAAFIAEGSFDTVFDLFPSISIRAGYEVLFLNELVLAGDNFNQGSPYGNQVAPRTPIVDTHGELFYHGAHVGLEYVW